MNALLPARFSRCLLRRPAVVGASAGRGRRGRRGRRQRLDLRDPVLADPARDRSASDRRAAAHRGRRAVPGRRAQRMVEAPGAHDPPQRSRAGRTAFGGAAGRAAPERPELSTSSVSSRASRWLSRKRSAPGARRTSSRCVRSCPTACSSASRSRSSSSASKDGGREWTGSPSRGRSCNTSRPAACSRRSSCAFRSAPTSIASRSTVDGACPAPSCRADTSRSAGASCAGVARRPRPARA